MPVDPSIPLGVSGGATGLMQSQSLQTQNNPLALAGTMAETQQKLNAVKLFNQTNAARQKLGQIMATAASPMEGMAAAAQDPDVQAFVPDVVGQIALTQESMQKFRGLQQGQAKDGFELLTKLIPAGMIGGREALDAAGQSVLGTIPDKFIRENLNKSWEGLKTYLTAGLPDDPKERQLEYATRVTGLGFGTNSADTMIKLWGQPDILNLGNRQQPVVRSPAVPTVLGGQPGQVSTAGPAFKPGIAPQLTGAEAVPFGGSGPGAGGPGTSGGNALGAGPVATVPQPAPAAASGPLATDGTPLVPPGYQMKSPPVKLGVGGVPIGPEKTRIDRDLEVFTKDARDQYRAAQATQGHLLELRHDFDSMAHDGGFLTPGSLAEVRLNLGKFVNMIGDVTGSKPSVDPTKVASAEDALKVTQRLGISYLTTALGNQREAAETIRNITDKGIPGIGSTVLGGQMMIDMIEAATNRELDQYTFKNEWQSQNHGDLNKSDTEFNRLRPVESYIAPVLAKYGLDKSKGGFASPEALSKALSDGLITPEQYDIIKQNKGKIPADIPYPKGQ